MKASLSDQAYDVLKRAIMTCELEPGLRIAQPQIVEKYNLGVTPAREALKRLEQEGYVQSIPRFGYVISEISIVDIQEIYELRMILETAAVRAAAVRVNDRQLKEIERSATFTYTYRDRNSYFEFLNMNTRFHAQIALLTGNRRLADLIAKLLDDMTRIFHLGLDLRDSAEEMRNEHLALVKALEQHDPDHAENLIREQILRSQQRVVEMLNYRLIHRPQATTGENLETVLEGEA